MIHARTKIIALVSLLLFVVALVVYGAFLFVVEQHKDQMYAERLRAAQAEVESQALSALEETVRASSADREKLSGFILKDESIIDLLSLIEQTAGEQGVKLTTESLTTVPIDDTFEELKVTVVVEGSFDGVMRMLRILETIPEQSSVANVSLGRAGEASESLWEARIDLGVTKYKKV